jgi:hypothetical protein
MSSTGELNNSFQQQIIRVLVRLREKGSAGYPRRGAAPLFRALRAECSRTKSPAKEGIGGAAGAQGWGTAGESAGVQ